MLTECHRSSSRDLSTKTIDPSSSPSQKCVSVVRREHRDGHFGDSQKVSTAESDLRKLFEDAWHFELNQNPLFANEIGIHAYSDRLPDVSTKAQQHRLKNWKRFIERLERIPKSSLTQKSRIDAEMFDAIVNSKIGSIEFREYEVPLTSESGFYTEVARLPDITRFRSSNDYENYLNRLRSFPRYFTQHIENLKTGQSRGFSLPKVVLGGIDQTIENLVAGNPEDSPFFGPFRTIPPQVEPQRKRQLIEDALVVIKAQVVPAYRKFQRYIVSEYAPQARTTIGAKELPNGIVYYDFLVHRYTSVGHTGREIHSIGLGEVERIDQAMHRLVDRLREKGEYRGSFVEFVRYLRENPKFYAKSSEQLLEYASFIAKKIDGKLPSFFIQLPRQPYTVEAVPMEIAENYTAGRYVGAAINGRDPGRYWVNTTHLQSRPLYNLSALTLHEAVPGHHLQNALAKELEDLPEFRRFTYLSYYGEGWALYAEWLGIEMGIYSSEYQEFGRLSYEMWRACRLVVDTGIHLFDWTREQAQAYLLKHTALSRHEVETEIDRYISWPGQALSYKMGELKIRKLRKFAETELGTDFDVRRFHHAILKNGPVSLPLLEQIIHGFVQSEKDRAANALSAVGKNAASSVDSVR